MLLPELHLAKAVQIASRSGLLTPRSSAFLGAYYATTLLAALLDGLGFVVLVNLLSGEFLKAKADAVTAWVMDTLRALAIEPSAEALLAVAVTLLAAKTACNIAIEVADSKFLAEIRLRLQHAQLSAILGASWEHLWDRRVGRMTAAMIEETHLVCRYITAAIRGWYFVLSALVFSIIALFVSSELTLLLLAVSLPIVLVLRTLFGVQSRLSIVQAQARQGLAADLSERLSNLFQIKLEGNERLHVRHGLQHAPEVARLEVKIGWGLALISSTNATVLLAALVAFYLWSLWRAIPLTDAFALLAGVGIVGSKAATHANNALTTVGNLARFAGSILPVHDLIFLPPQTPRPPIAEKILRVELRDVAYRHSESSGLSGVNLIVEAGNPLLLRGPSGAGKTTLANLIAGIYLPHEGTAEYIGASSRRYDSCRYSARVGYVPQDIAVFQGTVRHNLVIDSSVANDDSLWQALEHVGASEFVRQLGGLDAVLAEAGRSLSGGERRRIGIARALCTRPDILILDEIMNGLDPERKAEVSTIVEALSLNLVVVAITHDPQEYGDWREFRMK